MRIINHMSKETEDKIVILSVVIGVTSIFALSLYTGYASEINESKYRKIQEYYKDNITTELDDGYISQYEYEKIIFKDNRKNINNIIKSITPAEK